MRELRIRDMPNELYLWLEEEAKRKGLTIRSLVVAQLWGTKEGQYHGTKPGQIGTKQGQTGGLPQNQRLREGRWIAEGEPGREEFVTEARSHHDQKGYRFVFERWLAHYDSNGGRVGKNPMKSWKGTMVTFEGNRGEMDPAQPQQVNMAGKVLRSRYEEA